MLRIPHDVVFIRNREDSLLSIIVPTLNASDHIESFFKYLSLIHEVLDGVDLVIVDGGSCDDTLELARESFVKGRFYGKIVLAKEADVSTARNIGIAISSGKYITFYDVDDIPLVKGLAKMLQLIKTYDLNVAFGRLLIYDCVLKKATYVTPIKSLQKIRGRDLLIHVLRSIYRGGCNRIDLRIQQGMFSRNFLLHNNILFTPASISHEDFEFLVKALINSNDVLLVPELVYVWYYGPRSVRAYRIYNGLKTLRRVGTMLTQSGIDVYWTRLMILQDLSSLLSFYIRSLLLGYKIEKSLWKFFSDKYDDLLSIYVEYVRMLTKGFLTHGDPSLEGLLKILKCIIAILSYRYLRRRAQMLRSPKLARYFLYFGG